MVTVIVRLFLLEEIVRFGGKTRLLLSCVLLFLCKNCMFVKHKMEFSRIGGRIKKNKYFYLGFMGLKNDGDS